MPIQIKEAQSAIQELMNPSKSHREALKFLPWLSGGGFKVGAVAEPPKIPDGFMANSDRQAGFHYFRGGGFNFNIVSEKR